MAIGNEIPLYDSVWIYLHFSLVLQFSCSIKIRDGPDNSFAGYTAYQISGHSQNRIPDFRPDIQYPAPTGYFNACSLFDRVTQIIETSQIFKQD